LAEIGAFVLMFAAVNSQEWYFYKK
jgi:hypothetical protein